MDSDNLYTKINESKDTEIKKIQEIYEQYGYGLTTLKFLFITSCVIMCYGLHLSLSGLMKKPFSIAYNLTSDFEEGLASSSIFVGLAFGSFLLSCVRKAKYIRKTVLVTFSFLLTLSHLLMCFIFNPIFFMVFRFIAGACIGIILPNSFTLLIEYLPLKRRSFILACLWVTYPISRAYLLVTMLIYMPDLQAEMTQVVLLWNLVIPGLTFLACVFLVKDSPRNLILINRTEEAIGILNGMLGRHLTESERQNINDDVYKGMNQELKGNICDMFSLKLLRSTVSMILAWCIHGFVFYGTFFTSSQTMVALGYKNHGSNRDTLIGHFVIAALITPPQALIGLLTELKAFGRKKSYFITYAIAAVSMLLCTIFTEQFYILYAIAASFMGAGNVLANSYASEVYPTKIRESALGFLYFASRLVTATSQVFYLWMFNNGILLPYQISFGLLIILLISIFLLPYETHGQPLDVDLSKKPNLDNKIP
jgi:MFS family permease